MFIRRPVIRNAETFSPLISPFGPTFSRFNGPLHIDYLRRRLSQEYATGSGDIVEPEYLEMMLPPDVMSDLRQIDWNACDLSLAWHISARLVWIWDLRCEQFDARVHLVGDDELYLRMRLSLIQQLRRNRQFLPALETAEDFLPKHLPGEPEEVCRTSEFQQEIRSDLIFAANSVIRMAESLDMEHSQEPVKAVLYSFDRVFYLYQDLVYRLITKHGIASANRPPYQPVDLGWMQRRPHLSFRRKRHKDNQVTRIAVALFAIRRLSKLWKAVKVDHAITPATAEQQRAYDHERDVAAEVLLKNRAYHEVFVQLNFYVPRHLHSGLRAGSSTQSPSKVLDNCAALVAILERKALELDEPIILSDWDRVIVAWYPHGSFGRYESVMADFTHKAIPLPAGNDLPQAAPAPPEQFSHHHDDNSATVKIRKVPFGRPPTEVTLELAVSVYWDLTDENAPRKPKQEEICDRLSGLGYPIAVRTLRQKIAIWRREGHRFPGARPEA